MGYEGADTLPDDGCRAHVKWVNSLRLRRGDRIEVFGNMEDTNGWYWWEYVPQN